MMNTMRARRFTLRDGRSSRKLTEEESKLAALAIRLCRGRRCSAIVVRPGHKVRRGASLRAAHGTLYSCFFGDLARVSRRLPFRREIQCPRVLHHVIVVGVRHVCRDRDDNYLTYDFSLLLNPRTCEIWDVRGVKSWWPNWPGW